MLAASLRPIDEGMRKMNTRMISVRGLATVAGAAAVLLSVFAGGALGGGDDSKIRWDIITFDNATITASPGGLGSAHAIDGSRIRLTGSGTFEPGGDEVTGGGTWRTFDASGTQTGSGKYRVMRLVSWQAGPGTLPCPPVTDNVGNCVDARSGLAVLQIRYSNGGLGKLVVSCQFASPSIYEGVTASKGFVDYFFPEDATQTTGNATLFHIVGQDND
jgi:hypothetical protein